MILHDAIRNLYPDAISISGNDVDSIQAFNQDGILIELNLDKIFAELNAKKTINTLV